MDTREFLQAILPAEGVHYLGVMKDGKHGVAHKGFPTTEALAAAILRHDRPGFTVYHACAAYREMYIEVPDRRSGEIKRKHRVAENALAARALWADIDVGEDKAAKGKGYADKKTAVKAVYDFCATNAFPVPMIVDSGNGLHFYWTLTEDIPAADWQILANQLKASLAHFGVLADPTRTADIASVLRPVGTFNRKDPDNPKQVKLRMAAKPSSPAAIMAALSNIIANHGVEVMPVYERSGPIVSGLNDDLLVHAYPEIEHDAEAMADMCAQTRAMRDTQGDVEYEIWRGTIGLLTFCKDGHDKAHSWSERRLETGHGQNDVDIKFSTWNSGPSTCDFFAALNPSGCDGCPHKGKIKTPLVLGRMEPPPATDQVEEVMVDGKEVLADVPEELPGFKYDIGTKQMVRYVRNKDGVLEAFAFSHYHLYPTVRICQADGTFMVRMRMHMPKKKLREFDLPTYVIAAGGAELTKELGKYEHMITDNKDASVHLTAYMRNALNRLVQTTEEMNTMTSFGWKDNMRAFLLGDRLYKNDGTIHKVVLGGTALSKGSAFPTPAGTVEGWAQGVNFIYNRDGMQAMQYALCSGFGSLLSPFGESQYKGIPVALTSSGSGKGKTTVCRAALYAFGDANALTINGKQGMTDNARPGLMGTYNNLPMLVDEITRIKDDELSALLYAASNGKDKERMVSKQGQGVVLAETHTWSMSMYMTANKHLSLLLASGQSNSKAEAVRIFEIKADTYVPPELDAIEVGVANTKIERNMGCAGERFIQWCVTHVDEISTRFIEVNQQLVDANDYAKNAEYRFYRQHAVCTLVAAGIMKEQGIVDFDLDALRDFTLNHIDKMCRDASEFNEITSEDAVNQMINALAPRIITTYEYRDVRFDARGPEEVPTIHGEAAGRYIIGDALGKEPLAGHLYVVKKEVRSWCLKNRVDFDTMLAHAEKAGWMLPDTEDRFNIGRGTNKVTPQMRCFVFDMRAMEGGLAVPKFKLHNIKSGEEQAHG